MASPSTQADRAAAPERVVGIVHKLLEELGSESAIRDLDVRGLSAHLERELGLGSLERVELMLRLGDTFRVRLPDKVVAEADTVGDLLQAVLGEGTGTEEAKGASAAARYRPGLAEIAAVAAPRDLTPELAAAQSLNEVLRLHAFATPEQVHIYFKEDDGKTLPITYRKLLEGANAVAGSLLLRGIQPRDTVAIMLPTCPEFSPRFSGFCWQARSPCRFIRHFAPIGSRSMRRGNPASCETRKRERRDVSAGGGSGAVAAAEGSQLARGGDGSAAGGGSGSFSFRKRAWSTGARAGCELAPCPRRRSGAVAIHIGFDGRSKGSDVDAREFAGQHPIDQ